MFYKYYLTKKVKNKPKITKEFAKGADNHDKCD